MQRCRTRALGALLGLALTVGAATATAQTAVLPSPADTAEMRELQVAYAAGPNRSTLWFGARLYGASDQVFVVVPAAPGSMVDTASDAWFEALREATNPRVLRPAADPPSCKDHTTPAANAFETIGDANHTVSLSPSGPVSIRTFSELVLWAQGAGLDMSFDQVSVLADLDVAGYRFVSIPFDPAPGETVLRTIRVTGPAAGLHVPLLLSKAGGTSVRSFVWMLAEGRATPVGWPWLTVPTQDLAWRLVPSAHATNYVDLWSAALADHDDHAWVLEAAAHSLLLSTLSFAQGTASVPSVASTYFTRASAYGDAPQDAAPCVMRLASMDASSSRVATACAPGALAVITDADAGPCVEQPAAGEIDPADLRCGIAADDFAVAFSGMVPSKIWLTRWTGRLGAWQSRAAEPFQVEPGLPLLPVLSCPDWDSAGCEVDAGSGGSGGSPAGTDGGAPPQGPGGGSVPGGGGSVNPYQPGPDDPSYDDGTTTDVYVETSCWGDSTSSTPDESSADSCGGDSSSSSSSDGDTACGGDSSSSSDKGSGCGGDSSGDGDSACGGDSSSSGGDSCGGDSSGGEQSACSGDSSSSGGDGCSGSGSGSGSSGCSGGGSSSGGSDCAVSPARRRGGRLPVSAMTILIVALLWPLRRFRREIERRTG